MITGYIFLVFAPNARYDRLDEVNIIFPTLAEQHR